MGAKAGLSLRSAAIIAGLGYLLDPVVFAEYNIYPKLVVPGNVEQTVSNVLAHQHLFVIAISCYCINFLEDILIAWALYFLLAPADKALSLLTALLRLIYATIGLVSAVYLLTAYRLLVVPEYARVFGASQLHAQVDLALHAFRYGWNFGLIVFGVHLVLLGVLIVRSRYVPWIIGVVLVIDGLGWITTELQPYLYPNVNVDGLFVTFFGELIFMLWLLIFGWRLKEPAELLA